MTDNLRSDAPRLIGFLLIEGFSLMSFASAVEPLRAANVLAGRRLYEWRLLSAGPATVSASSGLAVPTVPRPDPRGFDTVFVCAAGNPALFDHRPTFDWLRLLARQGVRLGGVSGGPFVLARAGLLGGYRATIHWEHVPAFREAFTGHDLTHARFEIDRDRLTCGGGIAALDMMHTLIRADHGPALAAAVSDWFLQTQIREGEGTQRLAPVERHGTVNAPVLRALALMEQRIDEPAARADLAVAAGVSLRQLERLFARHLGTGIEAHYLALRLTRARQLLRGTGMRVVDVAVACGFKGVSHFSRRYRARFGVSPRAERE